MSKDEIFRRYAGMWVALKHGVVVDARMSAHELHLGLHEMDIRDATVIRCPDVSEPELVGLG